jgi:IS5 family transposase
MSLLSTFKEQLTHTHPLHILADKIDCQTFEKEFSKCYNDKLGRATKPIRLMTGLLILKQVRNLSDESVVEQLQENSYYQYFWGSITR